MNFIARVHLPMAARSRTDAMQESGESGIIMSEKEHPSFEPRKIGIGFILSVRHYEEKFILRRWAEIYASHLRL